MHGGRRRRQCPPTIGYKKADESMVFDFPVKLVPAAKLMQQKLSSVTAQLERLAGRPDVYPAPYRLDMARVLDIDAHGPTY